ncbi:type VI secretion system protein TssA [Massilia sp. ST3]|uniref:type VI secretion system protein TssA n=1 Tax=Massilia sp. ST3 TaxID=2824903 RepID=UPI001B81E593|nr:type VI secretion system protein TssA [Massilia sp. ST3]MBQ5949657.1 type VI secretion system protein TssA [Massilia sp. ST3]
MFNIDALLAPIAPDDPCGEDLAFSPEVDEIARARLADDPSLEQGAWVTTLKEADWKFVGKRCALLIEARSKDLQLAVWLAEASARTGGLRGLAEGLRLVAALCERYWDGLHPLADEDGFERRIGNLAWIAARISSLAKAVPVLENGASMLQWETRHAQGGDGEAAELETARARSSAAFFAGVAADADACLAALDELERAVDARLGADGPSFSVARAVLRDVKDFVTPAGGAVAVQSAPAATLGTAVVRAAAPIVLAEGPLQHREQALAQLRQVAEFFRRTEPHSPVAYLAEKAARWGEQPLHAWLRSVIKDDASLARLEELLGIEAVE